MTECPDSSITSNSNIWSLTLSGVAEKISPNAKFGIKKGELTNL